jgi:hypothetical protein
VEGVDLFLHVPILPCDAPSLLADGARGGDGRVGTGGLG